jgi:ribose transport system ATP-binding protein
MRPVPVNTPDQQVLLRASGVAKNYGAVTALVDASLTLARGEVHALMGANGAGKSTFVKILTGAVRPTAGEILIKGQPRSMRSPAQARRAGLVSVYQEPAFIPDLDIASNLRLSDAPAESFAERVRELGISDLDLRAVARDVPLAVLRVFDLARALAINPDVIVLDEMTAALPADLAERVLEVVRRRCETGKSVIFISHRLVEISSLCHRATVLRGGRTVGVVEMAQGAHERIVELMLGEKIEASQRRTAAPAATERAAPPRLRAKQLSVTNRLHGVSFDLFRGEILGLVALEGQGQGELFDVLSGSSSAPSGTIEIDGRAVRFSHPADAIREGLALVPGDRAEGLLMQRSVRENIALPFSARIGKWGLSKGRVEEQAVDNAIRRLQIDTRAQAEVQRLSGGNQQKVTIARWIATDAQTILCFDPTRGIDIGTKHEIYRLLRELAGQGASVLLYTSELAEVQLVCDRAIVIFGGRVVDELPAADASEAALMRAAYGLARQPVTQQGSTQ